MCHEFWAYNPRRTLTVSTLQDFATAYTDIDSYLNALSNSKINTTVQGYRGDYTYSGSYRAPWSIDILGETFTSTFAYEAVSTSNTDLSYGEYEGRAIYETADMEYISPITVDADSGGSSGGGEVQVSTLSIDLETAFSAMALNRKIISNAGYATGTGYDCSGEDICQEFEFIPPDGNDVSQIQIDGENAIRTEEYFNISDPIYGSSSSSHYLRWIEANIPFKYDLFSETMDAMTCAQSKGLYCDYYGVLSDDDDICPGGQDIKASDESINVVQFATSDDLSCGVMTGAKVITRDDTTPHSKSLCGEWWGISSYLISSSGSKVF